MNVQRNMAKRHEKTPEWVEQRRTVAPWVDVYENPQELLLMADMPGVNKDAVNIRLDKNQLTLEGAVKDPELSGEAGFMFSRTFLIPNGIDPDRIAAKLKHGVLTVHLPKHDKLRPRQITVTDG